jgi:hypothetical protein
MTLISSDHHGIGASRLLCGLARLRPRDAAGWLVTRRVGALWCALVALILVTAAACGGGSGDNDASSPPGTCAPSAAGSGPLTALPGAGDGDGPDATCTPAGSGAGSTGGSTGGSGAATLPGDSASPTPTGSDCNQQACSAAPTATPTLSPDETEADCPYIDNTTAADLEGNRIGKTTVLNTTPPGCRFYFAYDLSHMTLQITTQVFDDPIDANNAMVTAAEAGSNAASVTGIGDGAALYQTSFYPPDGPNDWACTFIKGNVMVTVNTDQTTPSTNARNLAEAIAPNIPAG